MFDWINSGWDWVAFCFGIAIVAGVIGVISLMALAYTLNHKK